MDDDDPFAVVAPTEKKMSTYLKKSKGPQSKNCVETSSHGTNSTRSTTASTLPSDDFNFFSSKANEQPSKNKSTQSGFHNSSGSGSANFDFGNGLEFGQEFDKSAFGDDGFGLADQSFEKEDRKAQSSRLLGSTPDPFLAQSAPKSMRNLSNTKNEFNAFDTKGFDAFGSSEFDTFGASDPFKAIDDGFANFGNDDNNLFGDDGFGSDPFPPPESDKEDAWQKREEWKKSGKTRSGELPKRSSSQRRGGAVPRRNVSTSGGSLASSEDGSSPRANSRKMPCRTRPRDDDTSQKSRDKSPRQRDDHSPVRRTRSGVRPSRRATLDHSGHTANSETKSHGSSSQHRPQPSRRGSVDYTVSDGSLEPAIATKIPPARNKSSSGPAHRPGACRKQRRASATQISAADFGFMQMNLPSKEDADDEKNVEWDQERSVNQEKIMGMYREGGLSSKSGNKNSNSSIQDMSKHIDMMDLVDEKPKSSIGLGDSRGKLRRSRKKDTENEEEEYTEPKDRKDRTKGSLLERVVGDSSSKDATSSSSRDGAQSTGSGLSYSDRIMMAQQRSKRN